MGHGRSKGIGGRKGAPNIAIRQGGPFFGGAGVVGVQQMRHGKAGAQQSTVGRVQVHQGGGLSTAHLPCRTPSPNAPTHPWGPPGVAWR